MLLSQTGLAPQTILSVPRELDQCMGTRHCGPLLFFPAPENVQEVSHRSPNTTIIQVSTSQPIFGKSAFSPQRLTTAITKLQKSKENPGTHLEMHSISFTYTTVSESAQMIFQKNVTFPPNNNSKL